MQLRIITCIPVYNHPNTVIDVITETLKHSPYPILVVDDGSDQSVDSLFKKSAVEQKARVQFVRHEKNRGKGAALQTAFKWAITNGYTHAVTIDADGQHDPAEITLLAKAAEQSPWALVIGDRQMKTQHVPPSSVFGKAFSNFWVRYQNEQFEGDSQSGFRIYPLFFLQTMKFLTKNYDFEIEVLTRLMWKGVEVKSTPISVKYFPGELRVTHFNKFRDNLRLTILNALLVTVSLLRREDSPFKSGVAVAIGVFVGCYPVYGLHTLIVALVAFLFRMNFVYLWLGTQISLPPLIPFLIAGAHYASQLYLSHPPHGFFGLSQDWLIGITLQAVTLSIMFGVFVFLIKTSMAKVLQAKKQKVAARSYQGIGVSFMRLVLLVAGLKTAYLFLWFIVPYYYLFSARARRSSTQYWKIVKPEMNFISRQRSILRQLFVFAQVLVDRAYQRGEKDLKFKIVEG
ncbi:MAG: DUF2062 domain-containing protein, partial [Bdellovibrionaceae bacterium]|nr:DUF2062 domain-containing protein [Bdellovibrio sp.]